MGLKNNTLLQGEKYKIIRFINSGGFGCTYEAEHTLFNTHVAIKEFFKEDLCNRDEKTNRVSVGVQSKAETVARLKKKFMEEAAAIFKMSHPGIVRVIDIFEENGTAYYVMDFIDGCSLGDMVRRRGKLPEKEALHYILQVVDALQYVHSRNRLHLDIKPGNIMVDKQDRAILIDFGASKHYNEDSGKQDSTLLGVNTPGYTPVEQVAKKFSKFNPATDIYALGATLYKLLTGTAPMESILRADEDDENEIFNSLPPTVSASTRKAIKAAMQIKSINRPQSLEEFKKILDSGVDNEEKTEYNDTVEATVVDVREQETNTINGHEYVDLGLSVKWATCNVGAEKSSDYGDYFAWGEIAPKKEYTKENSVTYNKFMRETPVRTRWWHYFKEQRDISGDSRYDAARANWGGTWRLPTKAEIDELYDKCKHKWTTQNGHNGYLVTGPNGNIIFLPAAGWCNGSSLRYVGECGSCWSSTPLGIDSQGAYDLYFYSSNFSRLWYRRDTGHTVRPVSE